MLDKLTKALQALTHRTTSHRRQDTATTFGQSMMIHHSCPCCCDILLRHMRLEGLDLAMLLLSSKNASLETSAGTQLGNAYK